ncbi:MAG: LuxR C-terminal-related transcriptional regulator [Xenococcaceae cyanobacterium MO_207.B15]|nr:LuxR C-terminal-related transcriptional regulator [Xenococcaceae cyanobacterium MO_207.B15]MDJ0742895.1 LuxR C-terminal-related transcriptional regulator [Xenococcaceae cyanobacterium MO_167.B27]
MATASTEEELRFRFMDNITEQFAVQKWGCYLTDEDNNLLSYDVKGVSDRFVERYQKFGKSVDPVLKYVLEYHAPAHEELVLPPGTWKQSELYQRCCSEQDHEHIMTGPIVGNGQLIGTIHFARIADTPSFNTQDLIKLSSICLHLSACLASLRTSQPNPNVKLLTKREIQIANLVAKGLTNAQIGQELWISQNTVKQALKRIFRKLEVASRTEMVMKLRHILTIAQN